MRGLGWLLILAGSLLLGSGCVEQGDEEPSPDIESTGMGLTIDFQGGTDVVGFEFTITRCGGGLVVHEFKELEDLVLPGMIPEFDNDPFDERSRHLFADYFTVLAAGCYDVLVEPVTFDETKGQRKPSAQCAPDSLEGVEVVEEKTTEVLLISQCDGAERGGLDVIASINHPPVLDSLDFKKFNRECDRVEICATAFDPNNDPLEFRWEKLQGPPLLIHPTVTSTVSHNGAVTECIEIKLGVAEEYLFKVSVYDLYWAGGELVRFPNSSTHMKFPVYAAERDDLKCPPSEYKHLY